MSFKRLLEGLADARPFAVQPRNVLCKVFDRAGNVTFAHAFVAVYVVATLAVIGEPLRSQIH
jgi:hypothetical protein